MESPEGREKSDDFLSVSWVTRGFCAQRKEIEHGCRNMTVVWPGKEYASGLR